LIKKIGLRAEGHGDRRGQQGEVDFQFFNLSLLHRGEAGIPESRGKSILGNIDGKGAPGFEGTDTAT
jgi:hypothetical protein